ncbi:MAG: hypothetical protein B7Z30_10895 [Rhizobiales bacterium 12-68-15]|nr:MAG: hypothetical protein B7Z30_10895 [Rhizobiales bacterium 12-68-15]
MTTARYQIPRDGLSADQLRACETFTRLTGHPLQGPFAVWLDRPHLILPLLGVFDALRTKVDLDVRLQKLMILAVARHWSAQFEWHTHAPLARKAGVTEDVISAIAHRQPVTFERDDERVVYAVVQELNETRALTDETFAAAERVLGHSVLVELIVAMGYFVMIAITLNAFRVLPANGAEPLPKG